MSPGFTAKGIAVVVYEPEMQEAHFFGSEVMHDLTGFKADCDVILANRNTNDLDDVLGKVFPRDLFGSD